MRYSQSATVLGHDVLCTGPGSAGSAAKGTHEQRARSQERARSRAHCRRLVRLSMPPSRAASDNVYQRDVDCIFSRPLGLYASVAAGLGSLSLSCMPATLEMSPPSCAGGCRSKMLARPRTPPSTECEMVLAASLDAVVDWRIRPLGHRLGPEDTGAGCSAAPARGGGASGQDWREKLESASPRLLLRPPPANRLPTVAARPSRLPRRRLSQDADASAPSRSSSEDSSPSSAILLL